MAISSIGVTLKWGETESALEKKVDIKDYPDLIGEPSMIETTTLSDDAQTFVPGVKSMDLMTFTFNLDKTSGKAVKDDEGKNLHYSLEFSDGTKFAWQGSHTMGVPGKGVDEAVEGTINIAPSTAVVPTFA